MEALILFAWGLGALIGISAAQRRGFSIVAGVIGGILLGPILAPLMFLVSGNKMKCPHCAEWIEKKAKVCPHCQRDVVAAPPKVSAPAPNIRTSSARRR